MLILDLLKSMDIEIPVKESDYLYNGIVVPRVTKILSAMLHEDTLMNWSNAIGLYKRQRYKDEMNKASTIGTNTHNFIEEYINKQSYDIKTASTYNIDEIKAIDNGVQSFILWYDIVCSNNDVKILGMEQHLSCPWYGGTYDLLIQINDKIYLVDFKTSNHIGVRYFYQLAAYKYMLELQGIIIDGAIILQVDKKTPSFEEYVLDLHNPVHKNFMDACTRCFFSLVYAYYNRIYTENMFKSVFGKKG